jgi:tetratricopeptide (TPR) repeat protein
MIRPTIKPGAVQPGGAAGSPACLPHGVGRADGARLSVLAATLGVADAASETNPNDEIHRDLGEREATVRALFDLGTTRGVTGDGAAVWALLEESLVTAREVGDRRGEAWALWGLGSAAYFGGDAQLSRSHLEESLRLFEELGDVWGLGNVVAGLAGLALQAGEFDQARAHVLRTLDLWEGEPSPLNAAMQVNILAIVANALGKHERAARLAGAAAAFRERAGGRAPEGFTSAFPEPGAAAAEALDEETFQKAWHEGQAMALEEALAYAREEE